MQVFILFQVVVSVCIFYFPITRGDAQEVAPLNCIPAIESTFKLELTDTWLFSDHEKYGHSSDFENVSSLLYPLRSSIDRYC